MTEVLEWACATYGWMPQAVLHEIPLAQIALLLRQWKRRKGWEGNTLAEDEMLMQIEQEAAHGR